MKEDIVRKYNPTLKWYEVTGYSEPKSKLHVVLTASGIIICNHQNKFDENNYPKDMVAAINKVNCGRDFRIPESLAYVGGFLEDKKTKENAGWILDLCVLSEVKKALEKLVNEKGDRIESDILDAKNALEDISMFD